MTSIEKSFLQQQQDIVEIAKTILKEAKRLGADQAEVNIDMQKGYSVSATKGAVETIEYHHDKSVDITVYCQQRSGSASLSDLSPKAIHAAVSAAYHIAQFTDPDPAAGLAESALLNYKQPKLELAAPWDLSVEQAIAIACQIEQEALRHDKRLLPAEEAKVGTLESFHVYANSHDFLGYYPATHHEMACVLVAKENDEMQRDYSYTVAVQPSQLKSVAELAKEAALKTLKRLGSRPVKTSKAPVIFTPEVARSLLGNFIAAIQGGNLYRRSSFLLDKLNQKIFPDYITIKEEPHLAFALGSAPFDEDGVETRANTFINQGVLQQYCLGSYSARKLGMQTTANSGGVHNLIISTNDITLDALTKQMQRGLIITELMGQGVNLLTGDYSRGISGFWVEHGEIQFPVQEATVAGNLKEMFSHLVAIANDVDLRGNVRTGSILIEEMMIAGG